MKTLNPRIHSSLLMKPSLSSSKYLKILSSKMSSVMSKALCKNSLNLVRSILSISAPSDNFLYRLFFVRSTHFFVTDVTHYCFWLPQRLSILCTYQFEGSANHLFSMVCLCRISCQTLQPITLLFLYLAKGSFSHRW